MHTRILATVAPWATRVAVLEEDQLVEFFIEPREDDSLVGNIFKGRVSNVADGMNAAFVDVGLAHDVFVPFGQMGSVKPRSEEDDVAVAPAAPRKVSDILKVGQEIQVQIVKEPVGTKGARGTTNLTIPGRYLVLMPTLDHVGISRKVEDEKERERLKKEIEPLKPPNMGLIVRTVAEGRSQEDFQEDVRYLTSLWENIKEKSEKSELFTLLYRDSKLLYKLVRDIFSTHVDEFIIDSREDYEGLLEVSHFLSGQLRDKILHYREDIPLFEKFGIEKEIDRALERKVWLKSGGYIIIEETEALCSIDVNTGRFLGYSNLEETAFQTNLEAADVIARQVRLRNLAGIIIIDFIDMTQEDHKKKVFERLSTAFSRDRAKTHILELTELGLVQMSRQRNRTTLNLKFKEPCPHCRGEGKLLAPSYVASKIFREIHKRARSQSSESLFVSVHPSVAKLLVEEQQGSLKELEERYRLTVFVRSDPALAREEFRFTDQGQFPDPS